MSVHFASAITKAASKQTYYTIRFFVDRDRMDDAYRSYAYFRWADDVLDSEPGVWNAADKEKASERKIFLDRQKSLLDSCYRGRPLRDANDQERMLIELVEHDREKNSGLQSYLRNMMRVMDFDAERRGRLISQAELDEYTRWLAVSVTENLHYFIGHDTRLPRDEMRYQAVTGAHIAHMLRDTSEDVRAGYYNIPREVLEANHIGPQDVDSAGYRAWVESRVRLARVCFNAGKVYSRKIRNLRLRLAGFAYVARFEVLMETIEKEGFRLRPQYTERKSIGTGIRMSWLTLSSMMGLRGAGTAPQPIAPQRQGEV
ncbi:MAG: squalene/phytoene synthase family protein [Anaerolineales bacterium]